MISADMLLRNGEDIQTVNENNLSISVEHGRAGNIQHLPLIVPLL